MKNLSNCISPWSWIVVALSALSSFVFLLRPTPTEFIIFFIADTIAFQITANLETLIAYRWHPFTKYFLKQGLQIPEEVKNLPSHEMKNLISQIMSYPLERSYYTFFVSWLKGVPGILIMLFVWRYERPFILQLGYIILCCFICYVFFSGIVFIESHFYLSNLLKKYSSELEINDILLEMNFQKRSDDFLYVERVFLIAIMTLGFLLEAFVIATNQYNSNPDLLLKMSVITFLTFCLFWRFRHLTQKFLIGGLTELFSYMDNIGKKNFNFSIPVHSSTLLAKFEQSFNILLDKIRRSDAEISQWVMNEADKSRYRALGEMSALVAHDLASPLNVIKFCTDQMYDNPDIVIEKPDYISKLKENSDRAIELTEALRARLKNKTNEVGAIFSEAHSSVIKILETQFFSEGFGNIQFELCKDCDLRKLNINRVDLVQVLDNLYRNAALNLLKNKIEEPLIRIDCEFIQNNSQNFLQFVISDNGTGMTQEQFQDMTSFRFRPDGSQYPSLGLKLTRRLIEINKGQLTLLQTAVLERGSSFLLELPCR